MSNRLTKRKTYGYVDHSAHKRVCEGTGFGLLDVPIHAWSRIGVLLGIEDVVLNTPLNIDPVTGEVYAWVQEGGDS